MHIIPKHIAPPANKKVESRNNVSQPVQTGNVRQGNVSFGDMLQKAQTSKPVEFSKHATDRLFDRNIELSDGQLERVNDGVLEAKEKGIRDSLVLVDEVALVVNIPNKVVITAMEKEEKQSVFTNIDGAVIV